MMTRRHFRLFIFYPFAALTGLTTLTWLAAPFVAEHYLKNYFEQQGESASVGDLSIDFFPPKVDIEDLVIQNQSQETLSLKRAIIEVEAWPLFTKTITLSEAKIEGLQLHIAQHGEQWQVAGIDLAQYSTAQDPEATQEADNANNEASTPWSIKLPNVSITDTVFTLSRQASAQSEKETDTFTINNLMVDNLSGQAQTWQGQIALSAKVNDTALGLDSQFAYAPEQANAEVSIDNTNIQLDSFRHFLPAPYNQGQGIIIVAGSFQFSQHQEGEKRVFAIDKLTLNTDIHDLLMPLPEPTHLSYCPKMALNLL